MKLWQELNSERKAKRSAIGACLCFVVCVVIVIVVSLGLWKATALKTLCTALTTGKVISVHPIGKFNYQAYLIANFEVNGKKYQAEGQYSSGDVYGTFNNDYTPVPIHYDPDDPSKAYACDSPRTPQLVLWTGTLIVFLLAGFGFIWQRRKILKNPSISDKEIIDSLKEKSGGLLNIKVNIAGDKEENTKDGMGK